VLRLLKNQIEALEPLLGESQFSFKRRVFNHSVVHILGIIVHNAGKEFKGIEMLLFHCSDISRNNTLQG